MHVRPDRTLEELPWRFELYRPRPSDRPRKSTLLAFDVESDVQVGQLWWVVDRGGEISDIYVAPRWRRRGIATAMWHAARQMPGTAPRHSARRSRAGDAWARSTGDDLPALAGGQFHEADYTTNDARA